MNNSSQNHFSLNVASLLISAAVLLIPSTLFADSNGTITYQGRILRPSGQPLDGIVQFQIRIYSPEPSRCLLWAENQSVSMSDSLGAFALEIGKTTNRIVGPNGGGSVSFGQVFINSPDLVTTSSSCADGYTQYVGAYADDRTLSVSIVDNGAAIRIVDMPIKSVPFAMQADQISGYSVNYLFKIAGPSLPGRKATSLFSKDSVDLLWELGTNQDFQGNRIRNIGTPTTGTDAATKAYVDAQVSAGSAGVGFAVTGDANIVVGTTGTNRELSLGTLGTAGTYGAVSAGEISVPILTVDMWGRISAASETAIPFASSSSFGVVKVDTSTGLTMNSGTLGFSLTNLTGGHFAPAAAHTFFAGPTAGSTGIASFRAIAELDLPIIAASGKVANSATTAASAYSFETIMLRNASGAFQAQKASVEFLEIDNGLGLGNSVMLRLPAAFSTPYTLTLPAGTGAANDLLTVDGAGNLSWRSPSALGAITYMDLTAPSSEMVVTGAPILGGGGTLGLAWVPQTAAKVFAAPTAGTGLPTFRGLIPTDIPGLDTSKLTTGTLGSGRGGTGLDTSLAANGSLLIGTGTGMALGNLIAGSGVVITNNSGSIGISFDSIAAGVITNVGATVPSYMNVSPAAISTSGTFAFDFASQMQNMVFAAPTGASGTPSFRALAAEDIPSFDISKLTSGTLGVARGGTGLDGSTATTGQVLVGQTGGGFALANLAAGTGISILNSGGSITISAAVTSGTLGWNQGGNIFGQHGTIGTSDNFGLDFKTNNVSRMTINAGGSVGIGTANPGTALELASSFPAIRMTATGLAHGMTLLLPTNAGLQMTSFGTLGAEIFAVGGGNSNALAIYGVHGSATPTATRPAILMEAAKKNSTAFGPLSAAEMAFQLRNRTTPLITALGSGNIGFGSITPTVAFEVASTGTASAILLPRATTGNRPTAPTGGMLRYNSSTDKFEGYQAGDWRDIISATAGGTLGTSDANPVSFISNNVVHMTMNTGGSIGIGTANPISKLDVAGRFTAGVATTTGALTAVTADFANANMIRASGATGPCGTLNFTNVAAGATYTVTLPNANATCTAIQLEGAATNVKLPSSYGAGGTVTNGIVYSAVYDGTTLWVTDLPF